MAKSNATKMYLFATLVALSSYILPTYSSKAGMEIFSGIGRVTFAPGLRTFTIYDHDVTSFNNQTATARREKFLKRVRAGLEAERPVRKVFQTKLDSLEQDMFRQMQQSGTSSTGLKRNGGVEEIVMDEEIWEKKLSEEKRKLLEQEEREAQAAFDRGFSSIKEEDTALVVSQTPNPTVKSTNKYQYVGVINSPKLRAKEEESDNAAASKIFNSVQWYARKKPKKSNWTLRLVHVDRAAILHHFFQKGKIDIYGEYRNTGEIDSQTGKIIVHPVYTARPRNLFTLWNLNPIKALFLDRSGHKYRERRIPGGIYTDGAKVYEASYDFHYGRNGMKIISSSLGSFLNETTMFTWEQAEKLKEKLLLKRKSPDVVVEF